MTTFFAFLGDDVVIDDTFYRYWLHHTAALRRTITGVHIHMLAPQTLRAMIGIACALHLRAAMLAGKIFFGALKFDRHN